jgi:hypothetical protein
MILVLRDTVTVTASQGVGSIPPLPVQVNPRARGSSADAAQPPVVPKGKRPRSSAAPFQST